MESDTSSPVSNSIESKVDVAPDASKKQPSIAVLIVMIIIVAGIVVAALYVWGQHVTTNPPQDDSVQPTAGNDRPAPQPI